MSKNHSIGNILILCEGKTEEIYLKGIIETFPFSKKITLKSGKKNSYKNFKHSIERSDKLYTTFIVIADLDRAKDSKSEYQHLEKLISVIRIRKDKSHIFLTYSNFEDWLRHHFKPTISKDKLPEKLKCKDSRELKTKENLYQVIQDNDGCIENAEQYFKSLPLFCDKNLNLSLNDINSLQSNLFYFRDYILNIHKE